MRIISDHGKKFKVYRSKVRGADIKIREIDPIVDLASNL